MAQHHFTRAALCLTPAATSFSLRWSSPMPVPAAPTSDATVQTDQNSTFGAALVENRTQHVDCVGVGVGPANLSLASLIATRAGVSGQFLERRPNFSWHDGQQLADAALQVSMLKDLVSLA